MLQRQEAASITRETEVDLLKTNEVAIALISCGLTLSNLCCSDDTELYADLITCLNQNETVFLDIGLGFFVLIEMKSLGQVDLAFSVLLMYSFRDLTGHKTMSSSLLSRIWDKAGIVMLP